MGAGACVGAATGAGVVDCDCDCGAIAASVEGAGVGASGESTAGAGHAGHVNVSGAPAIIVAGTAGANAGLLATDGATTADDATRVAEGGGGVAVAA